MARDTVQDFAESVRVALLAPTISVWVSYCTLTGKNCCETFKFYHLPIAAHASSQRIMRWVTVCMYMCASAPAP